MNKNIIRGVFLFLLLMSFSSSLFTANAATSVSSGTTGDCSWEIIRGTSGYELHISGIGEMGDYYGDTSPYTSPPYSYYNNGNITFSKIVIKGEVWTIGREAFRGCRFRSIDLGNYVEEIHRGAFQGCSGFTSIVIPDSVVSIEKYAFADCADLDSIYLSTNISDMHYAAFGEYIDVNPNYSGILDDADNVDNRTILTDVWFGGSETDVQDSWFEGSYWYTPNSTFPLSKNPLYSPEWHYNTCSNHKHTYYNCLDATCQYCEYKRNSSYLSHTYTNTCDTSCNICGYIRSVSHNYGNWQTRTKATCISEGEEYRICSICNDEQTNVIPITATHSYVNAVCTVCGAVDSSWKYYVSNGCVKIIGYEGTDTKISIPTSLDGYPVTEIRSQAFYESPVTEVTIPYGVTTIGSSAFLCSELTKIVISDSVTTIGSFAFDETNLTSITFPDSVTSVGVCCLANCRNLTSATLSANITNIPKQMFLECENLKKLTIVDGVTSIGKEAFYNCKELNTIIIPNTIESVEQSAFSKCESLENVYYCGNASEWGEITIADYNTYLSSANRYYHNITDESVIAEPTCSSEGEKVGICLICQREVHNSIPFSDVHTYAAGTYTEQEHPHKIYNVCRCGLKEDSGENSIDSDCIDCYPAPSVTGITCTPTTAKVGELVTFTLNAIGATDYQFFIINNDDVIFQTWIVKENQVSYTFDKEGVYSIEGYAYNGKTSTPAATLKITVSPLTISVTSVSLNKTSVTMDVGTTETLIATVSPNNATNKSVTWKSSNTSVASVLNGVVTANAVGTATITATTADGNKTAACVVTVDYKVKISVFDYQVIGTYVLIDLSVDNMTDAATLYFATYDESGRMLEIQTPTLTDGSTRIILPLGTIHKIKAFVWKDNLQPITRYAEKVL